MNLRVLVPNSYIHVSVSYSPICTPILLQKNGWTDRGNISIAQDTECGNWERGRAISFLGIHKSDLVCSVVQHHQPNGCCSVIRELNKYEVFTTLFTYSALQIKYLHVLPFTLEQMAIGMRTKA
jgi:hypothetical protein